MDRILHNLCLILLYAKSFYRDNHKTVEKTLGERIFKYLFNGQFNGQFNGPWAGAIHSFPGIPPIYRYVTHLPITIKRGFRETSGQRAFKYLFGEGVGRVRGWDSRGHQYPKNIQCQGSPPEKKQCRVPLSPKKNSANGLPKKNSAKGLLPKNIQCRVPLPPRKYQV